MVSIKRRMALAYSSLFIAMLGLLLYIEVWKLLLSYLPGNGAHEEHAYKRFDLSRSGKDADKELWGLSDLHSQHSSSDQEQQQRRRGRQEQEQQRQQKQKSPACHPHFRHLSSKPSWAWSEDTKFKRLYFYHARKAGGTSLAHYFSMVARHHGLKFEHVEWLEAEEPGTHELPTFYVTHLREPVSRIVPRGKVPRLS
jgi:hypothetical protein